MTKTTSLAAFFGTDQIDFQVIDPSNYVHMIIDVQAIYCKRFPKGRGSGHTEYVAGKIAKQKPLIEEFGIRSLIVFQDGRDRGHQIAGDGLYKIKYDPQKDMISPKQGNFRNSGFQGSQAEKMLSDQNIRNAIVSGFNAEACIAQIVTDLLRQDFNVLLLADCIGQDQYHDSKRARSSVRESIDNMRNLGAKATTSKNLREFLAISTLQPS